MGTDCQLVQVPTVLVLESLGKLVNFHRKLTESTLLLLHNPFIAPGPHTDYLQSTNSLLSRLYLHYHYPVIT